MALFESGRAIIYTDQVPYETDILRTNLYKMTESCALAATTLGVGVNYQTMVRGFPCVPITPPGLSVVVGSDQTPDIIYSLQPLDATPYGVLPADTTASHYQFKQGFNFDPVTLSTPAPVTPGDSVIHLVQVAFSTVDENNVSRPYFNSTDPSMPIFQSNYDTRQDIAIIQLKQGVEAPSPTAPTPDPGFTALWYVTVAYGQTSIVSGNIAKVSTVEGQPFITESLTQKISSSYVDTNFLSILDAQKNTYTAAQDIGTTNHLIANPSSAYPAYVANMGIVVIPANTNTGNSDLNVSGHGAAQIIKIIDGISYALDQGDMISGYPYLFYQENTGKWVITNPSNSYVSIKNLRSSAYDNFVDTGTPNNIVITPSPAYPIVQGTQVKVFMQNSNTGASTITINGTPYAITKSLAITLGRIALSGGELVNGSWAYLLYDGTDFELTNPSIQSILYAQVSLSGAQTIGAGVTSTVNFDTIVSDIYSSVSSLPNIDALITGRFRATVALGGAGAGAGGLYAYLLVNGVQKITLFENADTTVAEVASVELNLTAGDSVSIQVFNNSITSFALDNVGPIVGSNFLQLTCIGSSS